MKVTGFDEKGAPCRLPKDLDEYYAGPAKRFSSIRRIELISEEPYVPEGDRIRGDFSLLRAFMADHDRDLTVKAVCGEDEFRLFFQAYLYGFVEDTFARVLHHKIEGAGYALRETVGKYEIRIREYDRLMVHMEHEDHFTALMAAVYRLMYPVNLASSHEEVYRRIVGNADTKELLRMHEKCDISGALFGFLCENELLDKGAAGEMLLQLEAAGDAQIVAILLKYTAPKRKRMSL